MPCWFDGNVLLPPTWLTAVFVCARAREWSEQQTGRAISLAYASSERMCVCAKLCMHLTSIVQAYVCYAYTTPMYIVYTCQGLLAHFQHRHMPPVWCWIVFVVHFRTDRLNVCHAMLLFAKAAKASCNACKSAAFCCL